MNQQQLAAAAQLANVQAAAAAAMRVDMAGRILCAMLGTVINQAPGEAVIPVEVMDELAAAAVGMTDALLAALKNGPAKERPY